MVRDHAGPAAEVFDRLSTRTSAADLGPPVSHAGFDGVMSRR
jgi:hypothetical protein